MTLEAKGGSAADRVLARQHRHDPRVTKRGTAPLDPGATPDVMPQLTATEVTPADPPDLGRELAWLRLMVQQAGHRRMNEEVTFTPKLVRALLILRGANRKLLRPWVQRYKGAFKGGRWKEAHQCYAFDWHGFLRDGQHRLTALAELQAEQPGFTIRDFIWFGIDPAAFAAMDTGKRRDVNQTLYSEKVSSPNLISATVRLHYRAEGHGDIPDDIYVHDMSIALAHDDDFHTAIIATGRLRAEIAVTPSSSALAYWLIRTLAHRALSVDEFWDKLVKGDSLAATDPILIVRNKILKLNAHNSKKRLQYLSQTQQTAWIIMAWNLWIRGRPAPHSKWPQWDHARHLPEIDAMDRWGWGEKEIARRQRPKRDVSDEEV